MSAAAKAQALTDRDDELLVAEPRVAPKTRVARDFAVLLGIALGIGMIAAVGMMLAVLLIA